MGPRHPLPAPRSGNCARASIVRYYFRALVIRVRDHPVTKFQKKKKEPSYHIEQFELNNFHRPCVDTLDK